MTTASFLHPTYHLNPEVFYDSNPHRKINAKRHWMTLLSRLTFSGA